MKFNYAIISNVNSDVVIRDMDIPEDISIYEFLCIDDEIQNIITFDNYVAFVVEDCYNSFDCPYYIVLKLNMDAYHKRMSESLQGYHQGMFWFSNELFEKLNNDDLNNILTYKELKNKFKNENIYT